MDQLSDDDKAAFLAAHPEWALEGDTISRTFEFTDFITAIGFVTKVAMAAELADHHPDIDIRWKRVTLALTTHEAGGLTARDTDLAAKAEGLAG